MRCIALAKAVRMIFWKFQERFLTEAACREYLFSERFPEGFVCHKCGHREYNCIQTRHTYQSKRCRRQTSVTAGTVMHHTYLPLTVCFGRCIFALRINEASRRWGWQDIWNYPTKAPDICWFASVVPCETAISTICLTD